MPFCPSCGKPVDDKANICPECKATITPAAQKKKSKLFGLFNSLFELVLDIVIVLLILLAFVYFILPWMVDKGYLPPIQGLEAFRPRT